MFESLRKRFTNWSRTAVAADRVEVDPKEKIKGYRDSFNAILSVAEQSMSDEKDVLWEVLPYNVRVELVKAIESGVKYINEKVTDNLSSAKLTKVLGDASAIVELASDIFESMSQLGFDEEEFKKTLTELESVIENSLYGVKDTNGKVEQKGLTQLEKEIEEENLTALPIYDDIPRYIIALKTRQAAISELLSERIDFPFSDESGAVKDLSKLKGFLQNFRESLQKVMVHHKARTAKLVSEKETLETKKLDRVNLSKLSERLVLEKAQKTAENSYEEESAEEIASQLTKVSQKRKKTTTIESVASTEDLIKTINDFTDLKKDLGAIQQDDAYHALKNDELLYELCERFNSELYGDIQASLQEESSLSHRINTILGVLSDTVDIELNELKEYETEAVAIRAELEKIERSTSAHETDVTTALPALKDSARQRIDICLTKYEQEIGNVAEDEKAVEIIVKELAGDEAASVDAVQRMAESVQSSLLSVRAGYLEEVQAQAERIKKGIKEQSQKIQIEGEDKPVKTVEAFKTFTNEEAYSSNLVKKMALKRRELIEIKLKKQQVIQLKAELDLYDKGKNQERLETKIRAVFAKLTKAGSDNPQLEQEVIAATLTSYELVEMKYGTDIDDGIDSKEALDAAIKQAKGYIADNELNLSNIVRAAIVFKASNKLDAVLGYWKDELDIWFGNQQAVENSDVKEAVNKLLKDGVSDEYVTKILAALNNVKKAVEGYFDRLCTSFNNMLEKSDLEDKEFFSQSVSVIKTRKDDTLETKIKNMKDLYTLFILRKNLSILEGGLDETQRIINNNLTNEDFNKIVEKYQEKSAGLQTRKIMDYFRPQAGRERRVEGLLQENYLKTVVDRNTSDSQRVNKSDFNVDIKAEIEKTKQEIALSVGRLDAVFKVMELYNEKVPRATGAKEILALKALLYRKLEIADKTQSLQNWFASFKGNSDIDLSKASDMLVSATQASATMANKRLEDAWSNSFHFFHGKGYRIRRQTAYDFARKINQFNQNTVESELETVKTKLQDLTKGTAPAA
jgi:hypothetical protein